MPRSHLRDRARALRAEQTRAEAKLWNALRNRKLGGWKWRRQVPIGFYIADFLCREAALIVEVDGATHDDKAYDERRTAFLGRMGFTVIRINNRAVYEGLSWICDAILAACGGEAPHLTSPRKRGEE
jgi:very-short-patch-repair endonuclease